MFCVNYNTYFFQWVRPRIVAQTIIVIGFLTDYNWWMSLVNVPAAAWIIYEYEFDTYKNLKVNF